MSEWVLTIEIKAPTFESVKHMCTFVFDRISDAKHHQELPIAGASTGGISYRVQCSTPIDEQIKDLRRAADDMEAKLRAGEL